MRKQNDIVDIISVINVLLLDDLLEFNLYSQLISSTSFNASIAAEVVGYFLHITDEIFRKVPASL